MKGLEIKSVDELVRLIQVVVWGFVVFVLMLVLGGIVAFMLYSLGFITQPLKSMAPMDQAFAKMLNDIVLILASSVTTIVSMFAVNKGIQSVAERVAPSLGIPPSTPPQPQAVAPSPSPAPTAQSGMFDFNFNGFKNPELDETWRAPPPPTTPPDYLHPEREEIANERAAAKLEGA
jgi:hypothetical protein